LLLVKQQKTEILEKKYWISEMGKNISGFANKKKKKKKNPTDLRFF
jgi:hypothetical protein